MTTPLPPDTPGDPDLPPDGPPEDDDAEEQAAAVASTTSSEPEPAPPLIDRGLADARQAEQDAVADVPPVEQPPPAEASADDRRPRRDPEPGSEWKFPTDDVRTPDSVADEVRGRLASDLAAGGSNGPGR
jgi:hypothetical protein